MLDPTSRLAALGKPEAYGPFLRMMADAHTMLQIRQRR